LLPSLLTLTRSMTGVLLSDDMNNSMSVCS
jgi:hypothetical protein